MAAERLSENDRSSTGNVPDRRPNAIGQNAFHDQHAGALDDDVAVDRSPLAGRRTEPSRRSQCASRALHEVLIPPTVYQPAEAPSGFHCTLSGAYYM